MSKQEAWKAYDASRPRGDISARAAFDAGWTAATKAKEGWRTAVRKLAIVQHVRLTYGGGETPSGGSCKLCKSEWSEDEAERHTIYCIASQKEG